jgi:hypothetical protein
VNHTRGVEAMTALLRGYLEELERSGLEAFAPAVDGPLPMPANAAG